MSRPIPVTLIGGYLGAGKTTLVNNLLRNAGGRRLAVLVNEFGSLPIDGDLIEARDNNLISLSGGCICCSFGSDLVAALIELKARRSSIDHLLIETSGVALPQSIVQSLALLSGLTIDGVIVVADSETIQDRACDRYMGDTVVGQLAHADIILLNKIDLVSAERLDGVSNWLAQTVPNARILPVRNVHVSPDIILGQHPRRETENSPMSGLRHETAGYDTLTLEVDTPCDCDRLALDLSQSNVGLLRAKGFLRGLDGALATLHVVGRRSHLAPAPAWVEGSGRLVCIGLAGEMNRAAIQTAIDGATAPRIS